jgi:beta-galactosidase
MGGVPCLDRREQRYDTILELANMRKQVAAAVMCVWAILGISGSGRAEDISGAGWRLWPDQEAKWKDDTLYLPSEVVVEKLPTNPPTGGWDVLTEKQGVAVALPTTVEEHFWGKLGLRPYNKFEAQRGKDTSFQNGNYLGVSWWWRSVDVPAFAAGQRVVVSVRGARLRSELYCNGKLCGYSIMTELPFTADITDTVKAGEKAQLAIRITNPGGHFDWLDFGAARIYWGKYMLPPSRGFGGLDNGIQLEVRDNVSVTDFAAINTPNLKKVHFIAEVKSVSQAFKAPVHFSIFETGAKAGAPPIWTGETPLTIAPGETRQVEIDATVDSVKPWDVTNPKLYTAYVGVGGLADAGRAVNYGYRYFTAEGINTPNARLTLNGQRSVLMSAISWGFWGRNGLWPDAEMAQREVTAAKTLGLNCLNFHRNIGKPAVLDLQDAQGLLRIEEPGGGKFVIGARYSRGPFKEDGNFPEEIEGNDVLANKKDYKEPAEKVDTSGGGAEGDPAAFWEKYEQEKILAMVKRDRSHPSLIMYCLQNESNEMDMRNPRIYRIFRMMHALDPSRLITFYSGGVPKENQVVMLPYSDEILEGSKTLAFAGWKDVHTCGGPCNYLDTMYRNPNSYDVRQPAGEHKEIRVWGEMLGAATPDDYDTLVHSFDAAHPGGYELADMTKTLDGYHQFLDKYEFRQAFPTDSALFKAIGYRMYYFWQRVVAQARADNTNDGLIISGWESTTIDNHSGMLDNHRFFKGDPAVVAKAMQPEMIYIQPRKMIMAKGEKDLIDVFLINTTGRSGEHTLKLTAKNARDQVVASVEKKVTETGGDTFGQTIAEAVEVPADMQGMVTLEANLTPTDGKGKTLATTEEFEVVDVVGGALVKSIAVIEANNEVEGAMKDAFGVTASKLAAGEAVDALVLGRKTTNSEAYKDKISKEVFADALKRVHDDGTRLVLWSDTNGGAEGFAKALADQKVVKYSGVVGNLGAPWFGSWYFCRKHWLLDGLATDCALDWRWGLSAFGGPTWLTETPKGNRNDGLMIEAPNMEVFVGFGADHNAKVGVGGCVIPYGKGQIVLYCIPNLVQGLGNGNFAINRTICLRLLGNALRAQPAAAQK